VVRDELERGEHFGDGRLGLDHLGSSRSSGHSGDTHFLTSLLRGILGGIVFLDALQEVFVAAGSADMLDADAHALAQLAVADHLGDLDTNSGLRHIVDDTSPSMVKLERHSLLLRRIADNVDVVTSLQGGQEGGQSSDTLRSVGLGEFVPGTGALTERVRHFVCLTRFYFLLKEIPLRTRTT